MLTQQRLKQVIHYDPDSGVFSWIVPRVGPKTRDNVAGSYAGSKYRFISVDGRRYMASHLAWLYMTGELPGFVIDHINQNKIDDRWCNLRRSDHSKNRANTGLRSSNTSGIRGVHYDRKSRKWVMQIRCRDRKYVSYHTTAENAAREYNRLSAELFGEHAVINDLAATKSDVRKQLPVSGQLRVKRANRERIRRWYAEHIGCLRRECAEALGMSEAAVTRHIRELRAEWGAPTHIKGRNRQSTQNSILDLYKTITDGS